MPDRYVLLGLAQARSGWFRDVSQWATSASIAAEFVKCLSAAEVRSRLASGRSHSALLIDGSLPAFDRDLVATASAAATAVIAVHDGRGPRWSASDLGVAAVLPPDFDRESLLEVLDRHARRIGRGDHLPPALQDHAPTTWMGQLIAVCGPGGTGASTMAIGVAQALAADPRYGRQVLLADLARRGEQAMIHDTGELGPGIQEVVEAHRIGRPTPDEIRQATFEIPRRGYRLLVGMRQPENWSVLRPNAIDACIEGLRRAFQVVVADVTGDVEGEAQGGSLDVEERNHLARTVVLHADSVLAIGTGGVKGVHSLAWLLRSLVTVGVDPIRMVAVINRSPRTPRARAELARALAALSEGSSATAVPLFVPERKIEDALRDGLALPDPVVTPLAGAVRTHLQRHGDAPAPGTTPVPITPGSLGRWSQATSS
ncbi:MAG: hypothetical protein ACYC1D_05250 [Acidimicrobiales bacterium]